jgi:hypothetical protein
VGNHGKRDVLQALPRRLSRMDEQKFLLSLAQSMSRRGGKAVAGRLRPGTLAKLSDNAHFPGRILANANRLVTIFKFPPTPLPINHGHKTGEGGRNRLRVAVLHPDTEPRRMLSFIDAGSWFAHFIRSSGAMPTLSPAHAHC